MALEIEVKIYVGDLTDVQARLDATSAQIVAARVHERNQLFLSPYQDFVADKIVLRLRQDHTTTITYKAPSSEKIAGQKVRLEHETTLGDYAAMDAILQALGYRHGLFYEKYRTVYQIPTHPTAKIMVDEMPFGNFVEVEGAPDAIEQILTLLGLAEAHRIDANYAGIFAALNHVTDVEVDNITFANFASVTIDPAFFASL